MIDINTLKFDKDGLIPAIVVDADSKVHFSKEFKKYLELED